MVNFNSLWRAKSYLCPLEKAMLWLHCAYAQVDSRSTAAQLRWIALVCEVERVCITIEPLSPGVAGGRIDEIR